MVHLCACARARTRCSQKERHGRDKHAVAHDACGSSTVDERRRSRRGLRGHKRVSLYAPNENRAWHGLPRNPQRVYIRGTEHGAERVLQMRRRYHIIHSNAHADVCIIIAIIIQTGQHNQSKVVCVLGGKDIWCMEKTKQEQRPRRVHTEHRS